MFEAPKSEKERDINKKVKPFKIRHMIEQDSVFREPGVIEALAGLTEHMKEDLPSYETILSDDISARPLSLYFKKVIDKLHDKEEKPHVPIYFLSGGSSLWGNENNNEVIIAKEEKLREFVEKIKEKHKGDLGKTLLVTEYMESGESVCSLGDILSEAEVEFDLAVLSRKKKVSLPGGATRVFSGEVVEPNKVPSGLTMYNTHHMRGRAGLGVKKPRPHIEGETSEYTPHPVRFLDEDPDEKKLLRKDVQILANELEPLYFGSNQKP